MSDSPLFRHSATAGDQATVVVDPSRRGPSVDERLFGKFAEHLGRNIAGGMHAQVLINPTFGPWEFPEQIDHPDGGIQPAHDVDRIRQSIRDYCNDWHLPNPDALFEAYWNGVAFGWAPTRDDVKTTPDVTPEGDRAQRVVLDEQGGGLLQRTYFPLHRTTGYELTARLRATESTDVTVGVYEPGVDPSNSDPLAQTTTTTREWTTHQATLDIESPAADEPHTVAITAPDPVDLVLGRVTIYPDDHINKADPEVVSYLRDADLPLLRWPGGNFVSGYDWRDGIGTPAERTSRVNPAWGAGESNLFGTIEFLEFCEAVGCDPMICVNAGNGTPADAAAWVEYCNGSPDTEMGALRAEHGHEAPFDVLYWEIGNELFGQWQVGWTTPSGNADRYQQFRDAMLAADQSIEVQACGNRNSPDNVWNETLIDAAGDQIDTITDHILAGGIVDEGTDPDELFHAFMGYAAQLGEEYRALREQMVAAGIDDPRLAVTELQLFADFEANREIGHHGALLTPDSMPSRLTISEPLYLATIVHECARMGAFVQLLTHSATVNHGGGLQKKRERTWTDPAHHGHCLLSSLAGGTAIGVDVRCDTVGTDRSFGAIQANAEIPVVDVLAVEKPDELVLTLVNRRSVSSDLDLTLDVEPVSDTGTADVTVLTGDEMYAANTYDQQHAVTPENRTTTVDEGEISLTLTPYTLCRVTLPTNS